MRRVCFYSVVDDKIRPHEWAMVTTTLGTMVEPFWPFESANQMLQPPRDDDWTNDFQVVNEFRQVSDNLLPTLLSGDCGTVLHGGTHWPRDGR